MPRALFRRYACAALLGIGLLCNAAIVAPAPAFADEEARIAELTATMDERHTERERIAAVTALARLGSKSTLRPLVAALTDKSAIVRGIAAAGLGKLGHRAALPALRNASSTDTDELVRKRATEAVAAVCAANGIEAAAATPAVKRAGFGNKPSAVTPRPEIYMVVKSARDDSPGAHDKKARAAHADVMRATMTTEVAGEGTLTSIAADARKFGLDLRNVDVSCVSLETRQSGGYIEIEAQLRLAISDDRGKMLSFLSGGAKVQVPRKTFDARYLPQLRKEALENAVRGLFANLVDHLRRSAGS
ncbi:MAG TPA: HEAT repeat domain-containing protein [Kofleriaceae bacterium]|nr:HEAT repeat domain-containing protein [Kofleriaceae bacterium]